MYYSINELFYLSNFKFNLMLKFHNLIILIFNLIPNTQSDLKLVNLIEFKLHLTTSKFQITQTSYT